MSNIKDSVKQFYNEAGAYFNKSRQKTYGDNDSTWPETRPYLNKLSNQDKVLDLGCGNGRLLTGINVDVNYLGLDFSDYLIQKAREQFPNHKFKLADITDKKIWEGLGKFDGIFSIATFHHLPRTDQQIFVLKQIENHLEQNGFAVITMWNLLNKGFWKDHIENILFKIKYFNLRWLKISFANKWDRFLFTFNKLYVKNLVHKTNLKIDKIYYSNKKGEKSNFLNGRNLIVVLKHK